MLTAKGDPMDRIIGWSWAPTTICPSLSSRASCWPAFAPSCAAKAATGGARECRQRFGAWKSIAMRTVVGEQLADLTSYQFDLLVTLAERAGRVLTRDQIMEAVRGRELEAFDRSIDVHMGRIRAAIEADPKAPKRILTVRGVGYVFAKQQD
jgi:DNA-binding response OmpR family regulator